MDNENNINNNINEEIENEVEGVNTERLEVKQIDTVMKNFYLDYSMSVIVSRALPDVRDGLKPSQRRILYAMHELDLRPGGRYRKCAKIAGDTSGNYHPHGEQVVYPTLVRMSQDWNLRYPLVNGQGNFGSIDGDPPAAMRYTEARLHKVAVDLMDDIKMNTVDYRDNYDGSRKEPTVFPSKFPNLLVNGSTGIAVGMATNMPTHNVGEVCDAIIATIENPEITTPELMQIIPGPDFPTGGIILGRSGIKDYFETGRGKVYVRGKADIHTNKKTGQESIIISEIPYSLNKTNLIEKIADLVKEKRIEGISDIRDESGRDGMRLVIVVKRGYEGNIVLNKLYSYSQLQQTFGVINLALVNNIPKVMSMKELIQHYIDFRHEVIVRRTQFELDKTEASLHLYEGLKIALDNIDEVIALIRASKSTPEANENLQKRFGLDEVQAKAILDMRLQKLTGLERDKIEAEIKRLTELRDHLRGILASHELQMEVIREEVLAMKEKYNDKRRSVIIDEELNIDIEDLIPEEDAVVMITNEGYIKRMPVDMYRSQGRGGKGHSGSKLKSDDFIQNIFVASTHAYILFFTDFGKCYWLKVYQVPAGSKQAKGKAIVNLIEIEKGDSIRAYVAVREFSDDRYVVMATKNGLIKKTNLSAYSRPSRRGIIAIKLVDGDELLEAKLSNGDNHIILATNGGLCNRFSELKCRPMGRNSQGVIGIKLDKDAGDFVVSMIIVDEDDDGTVLSISENGFGKRTKLEQYSTTNRGTKGFRTLKTSRRNGALVKLLYIKEEQDLMITTKSGIIIRQPASSISSISRNTQGVRLINLDKGDKVYDAAKITNEEVEEATEE